MSRGKTVCVNSVDSIVEKSEEGRRSRRTYISGSF